MTGQAQLIRALTGATADTGPFDARDFRNALGAFGTGVTVVTAAIAGAPQGQAAREGKAGHFVGLTANSFSSVSLSPPLVLWSLALSSPSLEVFRSATHFVVNVLAEDQIGLSRRFGRSGDDKFAGVEHRLAACGAPILTGVSAYFECRTQAHYDGGDHVIFLGRVERYEHTEKPALLFSRGRYLNAQPAESAEALSFWEV
jgi:flavin reductase (DIM6/NTAB) family NADH-FMN oxidoreductase RutF